MPCHERQRQRLPDKMSSRRKRLNRELLNAVVMRDTVQVRELLSIGADVGARDSEHDETPLILAAKFADLAMVQLLLDTRAEINARDDKGRTALFFAQISSEVFKLLLQAGADPHARDNEGNTILMTTVSSSPTLSEVDELLQLGIDASHQNENGETAVELADQLGLAKIVERLTKVGG